MSYKNTTMPRATFSNVEIVPLSTRKKNLVRLAEVVPYTTEELTQLKNLIDGYLSVTYHDKFEMFNLMDAIEDQISGRGIWVNWGEPCWFFGYETGNYKSLNLMQYMLLYYPKIFLFLTCVKEKEIVLYLKKNPIKMFAEWRIKIGK